MNKKSKNRTLNRLALNDPDILTFTKNEQKNVLGADRCLITQIIVCDIIATNWDEGGTQYNCFLHCNGEVYTFPPGSDCNDLNERYCLNQAEGCSGMCG